jgi:hypothetical protein
VATAEPIIAQMAAFSSKGDFASRAASCICRAAAWSGL